MPLYDVVQIITVIPICQLGIIYIFCALNVLQRPLDITEQVGFGFEPGRKAHQTVADPELGPLLGLEARMRRCRRMGDETLGIAEII